MHGWMGGGWMDRCIATDGWIAFSSGIGSHDWGGWQTPNLHIGQQAGDPGKSVEAVGRPNSLFFRGSQSVFSEVLQLTGETPHRTEGNLLYSKPTPLCCCHLKSLHGNITRALDQVSGYRGLTKVTHKISYHNTHLFQV